MTALHRKLLRDLRSTLPQAIAITLVILCGVGTLVMALSTLDALKRSRQSYYDRYHFADVFTILKRAPRSLLTKIETIPGVTHAQPGIVAQVNLSLAGFDEPITGQLVAIPEQRGPRLNDLHLRKGRWIEKRRGEVIVSEAFAQAHQLTIGHSLSAVINGNFQELRIVGIAISPEFIYEVGPGSLFPDNKRFGVVWMGQEELAASFDMEEAFNQVSLTLGPEANEEEVIRRLDLLTATYGGLGAHGHDQHVSARFLDEDIKQLGSMAMITPMIFLGVAAFLLNMVLSRLINAQREQIASLKAFGYHRREIERHYFAFAAVIVALGSLLGVWVGHLLGRGMSGLYGQFYRFPHIDFQLELKVILIAVLASSLAGALAVFRSVRRAVACPPAEAMHPKPPARFRVTVAERLGLAPFLSPVARMIFRQIERHPIKTLMSLTGIAMAVAILILSNFGNDAIQHIMDFQMNHTQRQDLTVSFVEPKNRRALQELSHLPGVLALEGFRHVPCRLIADHRSYDLALTSLAPNAQLARLAGTDGALLQPPDSDGLLLSEKLADLLGIAPGDAVLVETLEGKRPRFVTRLERVVEDYTGLGAYMNGEALRKFMREAATVSGAYLQIDTLQSAELYRRLKALPGVASVSNQQVAMKSFEETFGENMLRMQAFQILFACIIAVGVIYNNARIALAERSRELSTLRVLGFRRTELARMLITEMGIVTALAIPLGCLFGKLLVFTLVASARTEFFRIPAVVGRDTYTFAALVIIITTAISSLVVVGHLRRMDMLVALKCKE